MTIAEGGGKRALTRKFQDVYLPTLKANFVLWPAVQVLNFRVVPIQFQIVSLGPSFGALHLLIPCSSHSFPRLVLLGLHTSRLQTLLKKNKLVGIDTNMTIAAHCTTVTLKAIKANQH
jgi:hypothetical protein